MTFFKSALATILLSTSLYAQAAPQYTPSSEDSAAMCLLFAHIGLVPWLLVNQV